MVSKRRAGNAWRLHVPEDLAHLLNQVMRRYERSAKSEPSLADAIRELSAAIERHLRPWGVFPAVCRKLAREIVLGRLSRQWLDQTIDAVLSRIARGEVRNPGGLFVTFAKCEFQRLDIPWSTPGKGQRSKLA
jgi:hypothetical protein